MMRGNKSLRDSQPASPSGSEDDNSSSRSPISAAPEAAAAEDEKTLSRGRKGEGAGTDADAVDVGA